MSLRALIAPAVCVILTSGAVAAEAEDRAALLAGMKRLPVTGAPGGVSVIGPNAFAVIVGGEGKSLSPVVAATTWENGRIVAFGHNGYLGLTSDEDAARLLLNAVRWAGRGDRVKVGVRISNALAEHLAAAGLDMVRLEDVDWRTRIAGLKVVCVDAQTLRADREVPELAKFIRAGGGLVTAATGWGWASLNRSKSLSLDFPGNVLLRPAGLVFNEQTPDKTVPDGYRADDKDLRLLNATHALAALAAHEDGSSALDPGALRQAGATVTNALRALPTNDDTFFPKIRELAKNPERFVHPTPEKPLKADQSLARMLAAFTIEQLRRATPEQIHAHPSGLQFPGAVPADAPVERKDLAIDTARPGWHSTGLYAAPGALIRVTVPKENLVAGLRVRIGCHTDGLWHLDSWPRMPEIAISKPLDSAETRVANAFGGPIYIDVPEKSPGGTLQVSIDGAVAAPYFVLGRTIPEGWARQRMNPAPWAELEFGRVILSVPSEHVRELEDPTELGKFWDRVVELEDELAGTLKERRRPERIVADVKISAGYMHSGYPIMTHLDAAPQGTNLAKMKAGAWGYFHELGHNHQLSDWTFEGTTEVTCNLFSLYVCENLCGLPPGSGHDSMTPQARARRLHRYLRSDPANRVATWKSEPFLALIMYDQLRAEFGWETYKKIFADYRDLPRSERPRNDQAKRDMWMVRFSQTVGRNLAPFFAAWSVPVSEAAVEKVKELPVWMPSEMASAVEAAKTQETTPEPAGK
jgi:hypothetical protein